jgi:hypothetical protein
VLNSIKTHSITITHNSSSQEAQIPSLLESLDIFAQIGAHSTGTRPPNDSSMHIMPNLDRLPSCGPQDLILPSPIFDSIFEQGPISLTPMTQNYGINPHEGRSGPVDINLCAPQIDWGDNVLFDSLAMTPVSTTTCIYANHPSRSLRLSFKHPTDDSPSRSVLGV